MYSLNKIIQSTKISFHYTGSYQTWIASSNIIDVKIWGAGGGGPIKGRLVGNNGGFTYCRLQVKLGENLTVVVGGGGMNTQNSKTPPTFGGGGSGCSGSNGGYQGSAGGGRSALVRGSSDIITSGGGAGSAADWYAFYPGQAAYPNGTDCVACCGWGTAGRYAAGGTSAKGGLGCSREDQIGGDGSQYIGGNGACGSYGGGKFISITVFLLLI